jgi:NADPH:quinone reductase-like Zn-dependent oxidoreductase
MKAVVAKAYGGSEVLQVEEVARPSIKANEVLVEVYAASASQADSMMLTGTPYFGRLFTGLSKPKHPIPGTGFAGVIREVGDAVTSFKAGDRVFGQTTLGFSTNAEYVAVPQDGVILPMPDHLRYPEAATFCDGPMTSLNFLKNLANIQAGQKVLINGASGSLGTAAVQLAKHFGAEVTGVCSLRNTGMVAYLGADHTIDYTQTDFTQGGKQYDIVFDTVGKSSFRQAKKVLKQGGQYLSPVLRVSLLLQMLWTRKFSQKKAKFAATGLSSAADQRKMLAEILDLYQAGQFKVIMDRQFPLERTPEAYDYVAKGHKKGNVVIAVRA